MWSKDLEKTLNGAFQDAQQKRHEFITVEHLLLALLDNELALRLLKAVRADADIEQLRKDLIQHIEGTAHLLSDATTANTEPTLGFQRVLQRAYTHVQSSGRPEVTAANMLVAIFSEIESQAVYFLAQQKIARINVINYIAHGITSGAAEQNQDETGLNSDTEDAIDAEGGADSPLEGFTTNLNEEAMNGRIDPLIGRHDELDRVLQILMRRRKNNPLLVGDAGVGKTAIAEGLAKKIVDKQVPEIIADSIIYALDLGALLAGTRYRGDFEKRFKQVLGELKRLPNAILFIDEVHTIIGAGAASGGVMDAANLLKPVLSSGQLRCIGSTTYQEYRGIFDKDRALSRRFQKIDIAEPSVGDAYLILQGLSSRYEDHYGIRYTTRALKTAAELSARYITDRFLPDKAIDVIDEAGAAQKLLPKSKQHKRIGIGDIENTVAKIARIPSSRVTASDKKALMDLGKNIKLAVFGQDEAIDKLANAISLSRSGLGEPAKPIGSFLFSGPTGVGKTEVSRQLAYVLGVELLRYDMSEYMERHTVSRLIGAPPGYVGYDQGGLLTEAVTKNPHSVVLFDEIEKAHADVFNLLLQVMDHGTLTDNNGRHADFRNIVLIMTTNAGALDMSRRSIGFAEQDNSTEAAQVIEKLFMPEFRNRLDAIVQFSSLSPEVIANVVDKFLAALQAQLDNKGVVLHADADARQWLAEKGYDKQMGARPMQRLIQEKIKQKLANDILFGELIGGGDVYVSVQDGELQFDVQSTNPAKADLAPEPVNVRDK